jgi:hypothetical protein
LDINAPANRHGRAIFGRSWLLTKRFQKLREQLANDPKRGALLEAAAVAARRFRFLKIE